METCVIIVIELCEEEQWHQIKFIPLAPLQPPATSDQTTQAKLPYSKETSLLVRNSIKLFVQYSSNQLKNKETCVINVK